jgi:hypothetical protein
MLRDLISDCIYKELRELGEKTCQVPKPSNLHKSKQIQLPISFVGLATLELGNQKVRSLPFPSLISLYI